MAEVSWRLLETQPAHGAWNMAVDQAILELYPVQEQPTLRFYGWSPPCVSLGIAQRSREVRHERCHERGFDIVRRPSGGRAILHDDELTYSIVTAQHDPLVVAPTIVESYARINRALLAGLHLLGVEAELAPRPLAASHSAACFDLSADYEITVGGRKLIGSAQSRKRGLILQQGTLLLSVDLPALVDVLDVPTDLTPDALAERLVALDEVLGRKVVFAEVATALVDGIQAAWGIRLVPGELTAAERTRADELVREKYGNRTWTERR